ncbi:hypothetical protein SDC9_194177 [bioreactor metagenome]|uniref:Uncharacterized protein n=1 Tax=bioreactor metagenome TaxID=1076179 RepID=A0A645I6R3_9ZZZZ
MTIAMTAKESSNLPMPATVHVLPWGMLLARYMRSLGSPMMAPGTPMTKSKCIGVFKSPFFTILRALSIIPLSNISISGFTPFSIITFAKLSMYSRVFINTSGPKLQVPAVKDAISGFKSAGCILSSAVCHTAPPVDG